ncbi:hypothetical protein [Micromonospora sp. NPDC005305]|uniref:hypothetical protein n=1 Tax=Micromonospora sp. NPDC005305 TaxID=3156875 RepID=UPI0033AFAE7D
MYAHASRTPSAAPAARLVAALGRPEAVPPPLLMLLGMVSTQVGAAVAKQLFAATSAGGTTTLRLGLGALVLLAVTRPTRWPGWRAGGVVFAVLLSLEPAVAAVVGVLLLGELLAWPQLAGVACVVGAALGATLARRRAE